MGRLKRFNNYQYTLNQTITSNKRETKYYQKHFIHSHDLTYAVQNQLTKILRRFLNNNDLFELQMSIVNRKPYEYNHDNTKINLKPIYLKLETKHETFFNIDVEYDIRGEVFHYQFEFEPFKV